MVCLDSYVSHLIRDIFPSITQYSFFYHLSPCSYYDCGQPFHLLQSSWLPAKSAMLDLMKNTVGRKTSYHAAPTEILHAVCAATSAFLEMPAGTPRQGTLINMDVRTVITEAKCVRTSAVQTPVGCPAIPSSARWLTY